MAKMHSLNDLKAKAGTRLVPALSFGYDRTIKICPTSIKSGF
ncbi:hypothetical protein [Enterococcus saigonensis]